MSQVYLSPQRAIAIESADELQLFSVLVAVHSRLIKLDQFPISEQLVLALLSLERLLDL
ncbi:hypothetical protein [Synechococcus elongatus]|uniref:hypothetical protein n=1 Tax=Synechococcus elongatus TaxID=32046 RepID=UPI001374AEF1|nr:hypothetical protein [Synechococcus elongatus]